MVNIHLQSSPPVAYSSVSECMHHADHNLKHLFYLTINVIIVKPTLFFLLALSNILRVYILFTHVPAELRI